MYRWLSKNRDYGFLIIRARLSYRSLIRFGGKSAAAVHNTDRSRTDAKMVIPISVAQPRNAIRQQAVPYFTIGQDLQGRWIAVDSRGQDGGIFTSREAALRYVAEQTGRRRGAALFSSTPLALWTSP
ncbi:hypothetical protein [Rhodoblastus sp.]|uniref:hypothetical protein n=1 Tax=Rhodoblastus sp. TaxID=1962975 RepID=UPI0035AD9AD8